DEQFKENARKTVVALQSGDADTIKAWKLLCAQSRKSFEEIYQILNVENLEERGESYYNDMLADTVKALVDKGL
ncbi:arginine--tRNA ligase, partial [Serratia liquefaciens]|uniref:arginine--tRNA ligase domain-containing protein n=1 Tax=Serratia liquefaciens TaxID=614 RepID=UPI0023601B09